MKKEAVICTFAAVILCMIILLTASISAPYLVSVYARFRVLSAAAEKALLYAFYVCVVPAAVSLYCLTKLLINIWRDQPFHRKNSTYMSVVSWCCVAVAVSCAVAGVKYMPLWFVSAAMAFLFLIIRVTRGCFIAAAYLKEENNLTI